MLEHEPRYECLHQKNEQARSRVVESEKPQQRRASPERLSSLRLKHEIEQRDD